MVVGWGRAVVRTARVPSSSPVGRRINTPGGRLSPSSLRCRRNEHPPPCAYWQKGHRITDTIAPQETTTPPAAKPPHDHNTSQSETHSTFWHGRLNTARMHTRPSCKLLLWHSSEPPPAQRSMINHNSLLSCRSSTHIYLVHSPTHNTVVKILKNYSFHDSFITVHCNE